MTRGVGPALRPAAPRMSSHEPSSPPPGPDSGTVELRNDREDIDRAVRRITEAVERHAYAESSRFAIRLAAEEAISNAFRHGNKTQPPGTPIRLEYSVGPNDVRITVEDRGPGFDPTAVPDPTLDANLEIPSGRGLMLMRAYMTEITFNETGNRISMHYRRPGAAPGRRPD